jgi:predicted DCC family thiol-disulfide oxidoreductase YuxK
VPDNRRWVFYYDGECGFCTSAVRLLSKGDLFTRISWIPYQSLERPPQGLSWDDLDHSAYLVTGNERLHEGFYAFRLLTLELWPLMPLIPILWLPGVNMLGVPLYRWIARNRYRISRCRIPVLTKPPARSSSTASDTPDQQPPNTV